MTPLQRLVLSEFFEAKKSKTQIANDLGVSLARICTIINKQIPLKTSATCAALRAKTKKKRRAPTRSLEDVIRHHIFDVLQEHDGNKTRTAEALGISLRGLRNKLKDYGNE